MEVLRDLAVGVRPVDDPFFEEGNTVCQIYKRKGITYGEDPELTHKVVKTFKCHAPMCNLEFDTVIKFELHYNSCHRYACSECKKQLPSPHLLDLHISETHDSFFSVASAKKPMYKCFVETCEDLFMEPKSRRKHCIEVHSFPHDFKFDQRSKKKSKPSHAKKSPNKEAKPGTSGSASPPKEFSFGHKKSQKSFKTSQKKTTAEGEISVQELMDCLPSDK